VAEAEAMEEEAGLVFLVVVPLLVVGGAEVTSKEGKAEQRSQDARFARNRTMKLLIAGIDLMKIIKLKRDLLGLLHLRMA
jgi:hypothetical protein